MCKSKVMCKTTVSRYYKHCRLVVIHWHSIVGIVVLFGNFLLAVESKVKQNGLTENWIKELAEHELLATYE